MVEFAANANPSASTKLLPFQAMRGYVSRMSFDPVDLTEELSCKRLANNKAKSIATDIEKVWKFVRKKMAWSQERQTVAADRHRKNVEDKYKVRDKVWLSTKNIKMEKPLKKLDHKIIGPYKIKKLVRLSW